MAMGMGGGKDSSGPEGLGADAFGGEGKSSRIAFYMDDTPQHFFAWTDSPLSVDYHGPWGSGYAGLNPSGVGWGFNPSFDPNISVEGQNFDVTGLGYSVQGTPVGAALNLQGSAAQGQFDPSISLEANPTRNFNIGATYGGPQNYGFGARFDNLFGVEGLGVEAGYGTSGGMGMISYGGHR